MTPGADWAVSLELSLSFFRRMVYSRLLPWRLSKYTAAMEIINAVCKYDGSWDSGLTDSDVVLGMR